MRDALPFIEGSDELPTLIENIFQDLAARNKLQDPRKSSACQSFQWAIGWALEAPCLWFTYADFRLGGISAGNPDRCDELVRRSRAVLSCNLNRDGH